MSPGRVSHDKLILGEGPKRDSKTPISRRSRELFLPGIGLLVTLSGPWSQAQRGANVWWLGLHC